MTTVKQLIDKLAELPPDTKVEVMKEFFMGMDMCTSWVDLDIGDLSNNFDVIGDTLRLGEG